VRGDVLYLCLEDSYSRIQNRLLDITDDAPPNLFFATMSEKLRGGLEQQIERFLAEHPGTVLIVIDTLQRIRSITNDVNPYASDYRDLGILKELADKHRMAILLIHHLRKMNDDDPINASSRTAYRSLSRMRESSLAPSLLLFRSNPLRWALPGAPENSTTGISSATDSNFVLRKDKCGGSTATLYCTGRDIEYRELTLEFYGDTHVWSLLSDSVTTEPQPPDELIIYLSEFLSERKSFTGTATELAEVLEKRSGEPLVPATLTKRLIRCRDELAARGITFETHRTRDRRELRLSCANSIASPAQRIAMEEESQRNE
jgi:hypothetical protein